VVGDCTEKAHWWEIDEAQGHTSRGRCRYCREERGFTNSIGGTWAEMSHKRYESDPGFLSRQSNDS
jgi:hypothetical protein